MSVSLRVSILAPTLEVPSTSEDPRNGAWPLVIDKTAGVTRWFK